MKKPKELTLEKKIEFCKWYIKQDVWLHICISFREYMRLPVVPEELFKIYFPELHALILEKGKTYIPQYRWGLPWFCVDKEYRNKEIHKLRQKLELKQRKKQENKWVSACLWALLGAAFIVIMVLIFHWIKIGGN
jgi:hypothetical protein